MEGHATISPDILARYAGDAARETAGVHGLVPSQLLRHRGVRVEHADDGVRVEVHVAVEWGVPIAAVGAEIERRVREYLSRMADLEEVEVDVVVDDVAVP
jgi:uncharacterized alkaline shock family protein YloU